MALITTLRAASWGRSLEPEASSLAMARVLCIPILVMFLVAPGYAPAQNRVLDLDGDEDHVLLPSDILNGLHTVTIEGWARWESFGSFSRFFDFGGTNRSIIVDHNGTGKTLQFYILSNRPPGGGGFQG